MARHSNTHEQVRLSVLEEGEEGAPDAGADPPPAGPDAESDPAPAGSDAESHVRILA